MEKWRKHLSVLLVLVMCLSFVPVAAFAEEDTDALTEDPPVAELESLCGELEESLSEMEVPPTMEDSDLEEEPEEAEEASAPEPVGEPGQPAEEEAVPAEPSEEEGEDERDTFVTETPADAYEFEAEEGVFQGYDGSGEVSAMGVYDTDYPIMTEFVMVEAGQTLSIGDTVHFKLKFEDKNGIRNANLNFGRSLQNSAYIVLHDNPESGYWEGEYAFREGDTSGSWCVTYCEVYDSYGYYTHYNAQAKRVMQRMFPGYVYVKGVDIAELITNLQFQENGRTLKPGDVLHISFDIPAGAELSLIDLNMQRQSGGNALSLFWGNWQGAENSMSVNYDRTTGHTELSHTLTADHLNGTYYLSWLSVNGTWGNDDFDSYISPEYNRYAFSLTGAKAPAASVLKITDFRATVNGQNLDGKTVTDGDTVNFSYKVEGDAEIRSTSFSLRLTSADHYTFDSGFQNGKSSINAPAVLNPDTGRYESSYTFGKNAGTNQDTDVYGVYEIDRVYAYGRSAGTTNAEYRADIMFLFAENATDRFTRLAPATNLHWDDKGLVYFTLPEDYQGRVDLYLYDGGGHEIQSTRFTSLSGKSRFDENGYRIFQDFHTDPEDGSDYYFGVRISGDSDAYYSSKTVRCETPFHYTAPDKELAPPTELSWVSDASDANYKVARFRLPEDRTWLEDVDVEWFFAEKEDETPYKTGWSSNAGSRYGARARNENDEYADAHLFDNLIQNFGAGFYYYRLRSRSSDILCCRGSAWTELSPGYNIGEVAGKVSDRLDEIDPSGKTPAEIKEAVQELNTEDLKQALLADEGTVDKLRELEAAAGATADVNVDPAMNGAFNGAISIVGAGLNDTSSDGKVTLEVGKAKALDGVVLPAMYDNAVAVSFSMDLTNVKDTENLQVPVLIDMPVPEGIDPNFLVILHYHVAGGEPEVITPSTYQVGGKNYVQFALTGFSDFVMTQQLGNSSDPPKAVVLDNNDYVLLYVGEAAELGINFTKDGGLYSGWRVTDTKGKDCGSENEFISVTEQGTVTAKKEGTAYVAADAYRKVTNRWGWEYDRWEIVRFRVDVSAKKLTAAIERISLPDSKATVEIFSTNYTQVTVFLETEQLVNAQSLLPRNDLRDVTDNGVAIDGAVFTSVKGGADAAELNAVFDLRVEGDRTLLLVPKYEKLQQALSNKKIFKGSYKTGLTVTVDGKSYPVLDAKGNPAVLSISVKQSLPKITASRVSFTRVGNAPSPQQHVEFKGGVVTWLELPDWLSYRVDKEDTWSQTNYHILTLTGTPPKASGKLNLKARVDGWAVDTTVALNYSVKTVYPTVSFAPSDTVLVYPGNDTWIYASYYVQDGQPLPEKMEAKILKIEPATSQLHLEVEEVERGDTNGIFYFSISTDKGIKPATYKVSADLCGKTYPFKVKVVAANQSVRLSLKQQGNIEVLKGMSAGHITVVPSLTNANPYSAVYDVKILNDGNEVPIVVDGDIWPEDGSTPVFAVQTWGSDGGITVWPYDTATAIPNGSYKLEATAIVNTGEQNTVSNTATVSLSNIKFSAVKRAVNLTVKGSIDAVHPYSGITLQMKLSDKAVLSNSKNMNDGEGYKNYEAKFYDNGTLLNEKNNPFALFYNGADSKAGITYFSVYLRDYNLVHSSHTYTMTMSAPVLGKVTTSKVIKLPVKMGKVSAALNPGTVQLLAKDRYSTALFRVENTDGYAIGIDFSKVELNKASRDTFNLIPLGNGLFSIGFKGDKLPSGFKAGQSKTAKLDITYYGNNNDKPNLTLTLKVQIK
ncbi:MAG: hypothetical protein K6C12_14525 [Oscillospiraceae bacterium]|nr:hypothetical protein [Oscillospiraceae bacterium]